MTIYLPDELAEQVKQHDDLNVSAACQDALRTELHRRKTLTELGRDMGRIELVADDRDIAFVGRKLAHDDRSNTTAYLTQRERIVIHDGDRQTMSTYDNFAELAAGNEGSELVADVARELGEKFTVLLDI